MILCNDVDLLCQDPSVFSRAGLVAQTLLNGTGDLAGSVFTLDAGVTSFSVARIRAGQVMMLTGTLPGAFPIVSVESSTVVKLSAAHADLFPLTASPVVVPVGPVTDTPFVIRTFAMQAAVVSDMVLRAAGVTDNELEDVTVINAVNTARLVAVGTLAQVYSALAMTTVDPRDLLAASMRFESYFRRALEGFRIRIDTDGDAVANIDRRLGAVQLARV